MPALRPFRRLPCYSVAEYCASVWSRSLRTGLVDVQLNSTFRLISATLRSTPLPWLPVLANIEPPALHRKAATDKLMEKIISHDNWPIHFDITNHPHACLPPRKPLWQDLIHVDMRSQWKENWKSAQVVNFSLVDDPTIQQPVSCLPWQQCSLLNHFWTAQGHCGACKKKWNQAASDLCLCGEKQKMSHIVDSRPLTKLNGDLSQLHSADDEAVARLISFGS